MKIVFKNGKEEAIEQWMVEEIVKHLECGCHSWQMFTEGDNPGKTVFIVNLDEVAYIK